MKLNKFFLSAGLFALALSACTDLDVNVESQYTQDPSQNSGVDPMLIVEAKMADLYFHLSGTLGRRYQEAQGLASDEFTGLAFDGGYWDSGTYHNQALHTSTPEDASLDWMPDVMAGITKANLILADLGSGASVQMTAPARAIRAYYTWILMENWGDAPILDRVLGDEETVARSPRKEVAEWIESELLTIIPELTEEVNANTYGKPTKWMATALLVKLYINWPVYTAESVDKYDAATDGNQKLDDVIAYCDEIINSGKFAVAGGVDNYLQKFGPENGPQVKDFIYAMPYDAIERQGMQYARPRSYKNLKNMLPNYYGSTEKFTQSFGGNMVVTPEMAEIFDALEASDVRKNAVLGGPVYIRNPKTLLPTSEPFMVDGAPFSFTKTIALKNADVKEPADIDAGGGVDQGYHSVKWFIVPQDYNNERNQSNDLPIFRYADILLTKAEALVRAGRGGAAELVNEVRTYAGASALSGEPTLDQIYKERAVELFDENWRRNDMIRFGHYEDEFFPHYKKYGFANFDKTHRIFPVSQYVLDLNPDWKQNPGY